MNKPQVVRFWKELQESTVIDAVINKYKNRSGYGSERSLQRYAQADRGFREKVPLADLSKSTGWREPFLKTCKPGGLSG
ncbi:MAG TPA: hypothetical protein VFA32_00665, partial [Dehalococcoidia bacterium]|nr:hypothetical protein [Dehalococcoidia bacterium]